MSDLEARRAAYVERARLCTTQAELDALGPVPGSFADPIRTAEIESEQAEYQDGHDEQVDA